jgi:CDP-diacylglycerol--glycerol-3-phosphate 3-phosphatidyltransferase
MKIVWNISNYLSVSRIFLSIPLYYAFSYQQKLIIIIILLIAAITDILDGYVARKKNQVTDFGKIIDPISDKVFVTTLVLCMIVNNLIPFWFFAIIISRDVLILLGGLIMIRASKNIPYSDKYGKATVCFLGFTILFIIMDILPVYIINLLLWITTSIVILSFTVYLRKFVLIFKKK